LSKRDPSWPLPDRPDHPAYVALLAEIEGADAEAGAQLFREACINDFWFFCRHCLTVGEVLCDDPWSEHHGQRWLDHPWLFARCREIQAEPDGHLDLWPRYHFKTALITQSLTLWDLIDNPELRIALLTYKLDTVGEGFMALIRRELEVNELLLAHFPDVFYANPTQESPQWTSSKIVIRRKGNPKEPSVQVVGMMEALPTSYHYDILVYDDIVVEKGVATKEMIEGTTQAYRDSCGLGADRPRRRGVGTHWRSNDTWSHILETGALKLRLRDLYLDDDTTPALRSKEWIEDWRLNMGSYNYWAQLRNQPKEASGQGFELSWLHESYFEETPKKIAKSCNVYLFIDSASRKKKGSDYTAIAVVGVMRGNPKPHYHLLHLVRDRLGLVETTNLLFELVEEWNPLWCFAEHFGAQRDVEHYRAEMDARGFRFRIKDISEQVPKEDRIQRLQPLFEAGRFHLPQQMLGRSEGRPVDLVKMFIEEEYRHWTPAGGARHDDMLDVLAWCVSPVVARYVRAPAAGMVNAREKKLDVYQQAQLERRSAGMVTGWAM
jgi:phage terminase large subunit-like protein